MSDIKEFKGMRNGKHIIKCLQENQSFNARLGDTSFTFMSKTEDKGVGIFENGFPAMMSVVKEGKPYWVRVIDGKTILVPWFEERQ
jgi:hypothetical protein